jgi:hypothetical protein
VAAGYRVIGESIAASVRGKVPVRSDGLYALQDGKSYFPVLVTGQEIRFFQSLGLIPGNGWPEGKLPLLDPRQVANLTFRGVIDRVDPVRFGPGCCAKR